MPRIEEHSIVKSILPIVFVIESSDNMAGERIAIVNEAVRECHNLLLDAADAQPDVELKIAVVKYGDSAELVTDGFEFISQFNWTDIDACGEANLGKSIELLDTRLLQKKIIKSDHNDRPFYKPVVIFFASSLSTDDYLTALSNAEKNKNFHLARKVCVAIGDDADKNMLAKVAGNREAVIRPDDLEILRSLFVGLDMPEVGRMPEQEENDSPCNIISKMTDELSSIVKVDGIENRDNFYLKGTYGPSVSVVGLMDVARCQCGPCEPGEASDTIFHIENSEEHLALTNSMNIEDLYVSFYINANEERTIVGCYKLFFAITSVLGDKLDEFIMFEIVENGIKVSNNSSGAIYFKAVIDYGKCTHLRNNDIIQKGNDDLFTVKRKQAEEANEPTEVVILDGDIGGWE